MRNNNSNSTACKENRKLKTGSEKIKFEAHLYFLEAICAFPFWIKLLIKYYYHNSSIIFNIVNTLFSNNEVKEL
jgi:hypothetical protein